MGVVGRQIKHKLFAICATLKNLVGKHLQNVSTAQTYLDKEHEEEHAKFEKRSVDKEDVIGSVIGLFKLTDP